MAVTTTDVEDLSSTNWSQLPQDTKDALLTQAQNVVNDLYGGDTATVAELEGNQDDAITWLTAHMWELAEGGETQSENSSGGSVSYNTVTGEWRSSLSETRYGRFFRDHYLGDEQSTSIVRTY